MSELFPFVRNSQTAFQFQPTLDGQVYRAQVTWNVFGKRPYFNLYAEDGTLIVCEALVGSPIAKQLGGLSWAHGIVTATTRLPHAFNITDTIKVSVVDCQPVAYNGRVNALVTGPDTLTWPLAVNPGDLLSAGSVANDIDLTDGYFNDSWLVFREAAQQFEVRP